MSIIISQLMLHHLLYMYCYLECRCFFKILWACTRIFITKFSSPIFIFVSGNLKMDRFDDVAIEWTSWRDMNKCACGKTFEPSTGTPTHCRKCGEIFCERCIHRTFLPHKDIDMSSGYLTIPICSACNVD